MQAKLGNIATADKSTTFLSFQLIEEEDGERELTELQKEIDAQLERDSKKRTPKTPKAVTGRCASIPGPSLITIGNEWK